MRNARKNAASIMSADWRLLRDDIHEARHHFAVEEALARLVDAGHSPPTLRLRQVQPAVFVGVHQNTWSEVNVPYCRAHDIQIVRRMNGGGAVYQEMGSFCFSAFFRRDLFFQGEGELYKLFALPVIRTCADFGVDAHFEGRNDVLVGNRKIFGSAQFSFYQAFVQSGTFLVNMDFDFMERTLTPPAIKFAGKAARSIRERVTSLSQETQRDVETREVMDRFSTNVAEIIGIRLLPGELTHEERDLAAELFSAKYSTDEWNLGAKLEYQVTVAERMDDGVISLSVDMQNSAIQKARISGDWLASRRQDLDHMEQIIAGQSLQEAQDRVKTTPELPPDFRESLGRLLNKVEQEVIDISSVRLKERIS